MTKRKLSLFIGAIACAAAFATQSVAETPKMKMTTPVPPGIAMPDVVDTPFVKLRFRDGVPDKKTAQLVYDRLDFQRATQAFLAALPVASMSALRKGFLKFGPANRTAFIFDKLMDSRSLFLTANTTSVYMGAWMDLKGGPMVMETPPNVLGIVDDHWFRYVADFGNAGPDRGKGGKYLFLPPGYKGDIPGGYIVKRSNTYGNWVIWRGFQVNGSTATAVRQTKQMFRIYPLKDAANPPKMTFINVSGMFFNTIHRTDFGYWEEVNDVVQYEPALGQNAEILGMLAAIGIEKGKPFKPDARMKNILTYAALAGSAMARTITAFPRMKGTLIFPGKSKSWTIPFVGGTYTWEKNGVNLIDARTFFHFYATGITPAMSLKMVGRGSQYGVAYLDKDGNPFDGSKTYKMVLPPNIPAKDFWSVTLYDNQTRSMLQTDQQFPSVGSLSKGIRKNADGSYTVYFGPKAPKGWESNWVQTVPGKGWNIILRLYGPLQPWFDKAWIPGDPEIVR